jgi:hypothetical protein
MLHISGQKKRDRLLRRTMRISKPRWRLQVNVCESVLGTILRSYMTPCRPRSQSSEATEHFFLPTSSESEEAIDTSYTAVKLLHTHGIDNVDPGFDHAEPGVGERAEAVTKAWFDDGERRPMKKFRIAIEPDIQESGSKLGLFPNSSAKNEVIFGTQSPRVFSTQAKKDIKNAFVYAIAPPPASELLSDLESRGLPSKVYQDPHYSRAEDVPERPWEFAGLVYHLKKGDGLGVLEEWESSSTKEPMMKTTAAEERNVFEDRFDRTGVGGWEYASAPPSVRDVRRWLKSTAQVRICKKSQAQSQASEDACSLRKCC